MSDQVTTALSPAVSPAVASRAPDRRRLVLATILVAQLMVVLDMTIVNVALPHMQVALGFTPSGLSWVLNGYSLTFGGLLLLGARAGDLLGRRPTFIAGTLLFVAASLAGGLAGSGSTMIAARAVQGVGAALAAPATLSLLTTMFPEGRERTRALGLYTAVSIGGGSLGLVLGGLLTELASWRWVMLVNVPIGLAVAVSAWLVVPHTARRRGRFDLGGAVTSTVGVAALVYGLVHAASDGWGTAVTIASFVAGAVLLALFVLVERRAAEPITPLSLFADRTRSGAYVARMLLFAGMTGMFFFLTQFLQDVLGYSPIRTGLGFLPTTAALFIASQLSARVLVGRFGGRRVMITGALLSTLSMVVLTQLSAGSSYLAVLVPLLLIGTGNGLTFVPLTASGLHAVRPNEAGAASGLTNVAQQIGAALGVAALVTVFSSAARNAVVTASSPLEQAHQMFVAGADAAFAAAAALQVGTLLVVLVVMRRGGVRAPALGAEPGAGAA
jgi:EmrB/QacA subfamily drug resistance transporter